MTQITVLIAAEHTLFREGLRMLVAHECDIAVVGEAADGPQAIALAESLQPNILLFDANLPGLDGLAAIHPIRRKSPRTHVLLLSGSSEDELTSNALRLGAKGCLSKSLSHGDLVKAIRAAYAGEIWAERKVVTEVLESLRREMHEVNLPLPETEGTLTDREQEIVSWVVQGMTNKEIAARLGISDKTVKAHLSNVFGKLKINRRLQLTLYRLVEQPH